jgi:type VI secretion system protein ImpH
MLLPGRTAEGMASLVRLLAPNTQAKIWHHDKRRVPLKKPLTMSVSQPVTLTNRPVMGNYATDVNSQVLMRLTTTDSTEVLGWLPGGELHTDLWRCCMCILALAWMSACSYVSTVACCRTRQ